MQNNIISKYQVAWIEFRAVKGIVTKHDELLLRENEALTTGHNSDRIFKHFRDVETAKEYIEILRSINVPSRLDKHYEVRICTDAQFGKGTVERVNGRAKIIVKYTAKQENEKTII